MLSKLKGWYQQYFEKKPVSVVSDQPTCNHPIVKDYSELYSLFDKINADSSSYRSLFNPLLVTTNVVSCFKNIDDLIRTITNLRMKVALMELGSEELQNDSTKIQKVQPRAISLADFNTDSTGAEITVVKVINTIRQELRLLLNELSSVVESPDTIDYLTLLGRQNAGTVSDLIIYIDAIEKL